MRWQAAGSALCMVAIFGLPTSAASQSAGSPGAASLSPEAAATLSTVERVCLPLLRGQPLKAVAATAGLKRDHDEWVLPIDGRKRVVIDPPGGSNKTVCSAELTYGVDGGTPIVDVLNRWALAQTPPLQKVKDHEDSKGPLKLRKTTSWFGMVSGGSLGVVLAEEKDLQGRPVAGEYDEATLLVSLTPA